MSRTVRDPTYPGSLGSCRPDSDEKGRTVIEVSLRHRDIPPDEDPGEQ